MEEKIPSSAKDGKAANAKKGELDSSLLPSTLPRLTTLTRLFDFSGNFFDQYDGRKTLVHATQAFNKEQGILVAGKLNGNTPTPIDGTLGWRPTVHFSLNHLSPNIPENPKLSERKYAFIIPYNLVSNRLLGYELCDEKKEGYVSDDVYFLDSVTVPEGSYLIVRQDKKECEQLQKLHPQWTCIHCDDDDLRAKVTDTIKQLPVTSPYYGSRVPKFPLSKLPHRKNPLSAMTKNPLRDKCAHHPMGVLENLINCLFITNCEQLLSSNRLSTMQTRNAHVLISGQIRDLWAHFLENYLEDAERANIDKKFNPCKLDVPEHSNFEKLSAEDIRAKCVTLSVCAHYLITGKQTGLKMFGKTYSDEGARNYLRGKDDWKRAVDYEKCP